MSNHFIADFNLERPNQQNVNFKLQENTVNADFNITATNSMNITFGIAQANKDKYFVFEHRASSNI